MSSDQLSINTIRCLAADMVQKCGSGHPGMPMGMAAISHVLWTQLLRFNPSNPHWWNRDRFVLSNGHGCALQYILLHLSGYPSITMDELKRLRKLGSKTPGHPEVHHTEGVEVTTGPLGQGICNAVGLAWATSHLAAMYNREGHEVFSNHTYVFLGDGCMQEGVASEAASLAGHWSLPHLIAIYDNNKIQIDGSTDLAFSEDVSARFRSYGWETIDVKDGDVDVKGIADALNKAKEAAQTKPVLLNVHTTIGFGSGKQGTHKVHGEALGADDVKTVKKNLGFDAEQSFVVDAKVYDVWHAAADRGREEEKKWTAIWDSYKSKFSKEAAEIEGRFSGKIPEGWRAKLPQWKPTDKKEATRTTSGTVLNVVADAFPSIIGGSADLSGSNKTNLKNGGIYSAKNRSGRYLHYGVREHGMVAINNGIAAYGGFIPFGATFLNFIEYAYGAVRLTALSEFHQLFIMTHDSIGLGEDGPTHQPIEALALCRATPNMSVWRPADGNETAASYIAAMEHHRKGPSTLVFSRQDLPQLSGSTVEGALRGGYVLLDSAESKTPDIVLISTGSEVYITVEAAKILSAKHKTRVVSLPSDSTFDQQSVDYRRSVIPPKSVSISVEALSPFGWNRFSHAHIAMDRYGASGDLSEVYEYFGFTPSKVAAKAEELMKIVVEGNGGRENIPMLPTHFHFPKNLPKQH